jgi:TRAP-type C4-dicarboxylate transport system permease small subunit
MPKKINRLSFTALVISSIAAFCIGVAMFFLGTFKTWAQCAEEDSAMGCPATSAEATLMMSGVTVAILSFIALWLAPRAHSRLTGKRQNALER